jgi:acyl-coenzyme A synthetase/AMP-(fatty) acid ligase
MIPSVRNAEAGQLHVLKEATCTKLLHSSEFAGTAKLLQDKSAHLDIFQLPSLDELVDTPARYFPYVKKWESSWKDPVIIAHSSGSTGFPKAITITNGALSVYDSMRFIPTVPGRRNQDHSMFNFKGGGKFYNPYPPFHVSSPATFTL